MVPIHAGLWETPPCHNRTPPPAYPDYPYPPCIRNAIGSGANGVVFTSVLRLTLNHRLWLIHMLAWIFYVFSPPPVIAFLPDRLVVGGSACRTASLPSPPSPMPAYSDLDNVFQRWRASQQPKPFATHYE